MPRSVLVLQHVPWERPGILGDVLTARSVPWVARSYLYGPSPEPLAQLAGVAILGGPMNALDFERYPGLRQEAELVRAVVDAGMPLLGVCLGHQVISTALGGRLHVGAANEVGVGTVDLIADDPALGAAGQSVPALHWHYDVTEAPDGAIVVARTDQTPNQAFRVGDVTFSTQFHVELDRHLLDRWLAVDEVAEELDPATRLSITTDFDTVAPRMREIAQRAFGGFADAVLFRD